MLLKSGSGGHTPPSKPESVPEGLVAAKVGCFHFRPLKCQQRNGTRGCPPACNPCASVAPGACRHYSCCLGHRRWCSHQQTNAQRQPPSKSPLRFVGRHTCMQQQWLAAYPPSLRRGSGRPSQLHLLALATPPTVPAQPQAKLQSPCMGDHRRTRRCLLLRRR